ncbi:beta-glucanase/beta-glucan synthetase [Paenibacillus thiaminolyticus]|uniref:beta-glucanase/beta-glucan synthetase n=1 Tax=Paenibacillus TaxID=44249 RepID=UPI00387E1D75
MPKLWLFKLAAFLIVMMLPLEGCSYASLDDRESNTAKIQPHQLEANKNTTVVMGSLAHQFTNLKYDNNGEMIPLRYDGGELKIDYSVSASGEAKNVGFLLFVDGLPQPYKLNAPEAPYQYMHIIDLEKDDQETPLAFLFTPVTGKQGDTIAVSIASVYNPAFIPDLAETSSYGGYHAILEAVGSVAFARDADTLDHSAIPRYEYISNVRLSAAPLTQELVVDAGAESIDEADDQVYSLLQFDGALADDKHHINDQGTLHVTFTLFGPPGARYQNTFYINHEALTSEDGGTFETILEKGKAAVIEADLHLDKLEDFNTFYVVSVPVNADEFPESSALEKTFSRLLYK